MRLSDGQLGQFRSDGYLVVEGALNDADIDPVVEEYSAYIDRRADELFEAGKISDLHREEPFERRLASICRENDEIYRELDIYLLRARTVFQFLRNDRLLDLVEGIVGPEITCSPIQHLRAKLPSGVIEGPAAHVTPWHQDMGVTLENADPHFILTVWLPLTQSTVANGCLEILPRTHTEDLMQHVSRAGIGTVIPDEALPDVRPLPLEMEKGSVLLMHKRIPHRSGVNRTADIRWSMDLRYQRTGSPTGRPAYPEFVARSRAHSASELTDYGEWCHRWKQALSAERRKAEAGTPVAHHRWKREIVES